MESVLIYLYLGCVLLARKLGRRTNCVYQNDSYLICVYLLVSLTITGYRLGSSHCEFPVNNAVPEFLWDPSSESTNSDPIGLGY